MIPMPPSRLPGVGTSIFTVMSALATEHQAINLSQGFPDFEPDPALLDHLTRAVLNGKNQYAPMAGLPRLREQVSRLVLRKYGRQADPATEITITSGATEALFNAIASLVRPGKEVIILDPAYDSYAPAIRLNGGIPVAVSLRFPDYSIPWDEVESVISANTCALILNSPHNPTGAVMNEQDIQQLRQLVTRHPIHLISDEVYEHIIFDGRIHHSLLRYPELAERAFVISSFGKTFHVTGWKTGYCVAPPAMTEEFRRIHQFNTFCSPTPLQDALADALEEPGQVDSLGAFYQAKRDLFLKLMQNSRFSPLPVSGTYFQLMQFSGISDDDDVTFTRKLTIESGVAAIPVSVFYQERLDNRVIRFCFAKKEETLKAAAERLCKI